MNITSYPEINASLNKFHQLLRNILQENLVGIYLYGSLALGDFDLKSSDIDILVAIKRQTSKGEFSALQKLHKKFERSGNKWAKRLEVAYMPVDVLRRYNSNNNKNPFVSPVSQFAVIELGRDWILNRWIIREKGVTVLGPSPKSLIDPISKEEIREAVKDILCNSWVKHVDGSEWMKPKKYQSFTILTMCRASYALEYGEIISKPKAAEWTMETLDERWKPIIQDALKTRNDPREIELVDDNNALQFLRFVVSKYCAL